MSKNLKVITSSNGYVSSVANQEVVIKPEPNMTSFSWKQLSLIAKADCEIILNENSGIPSSFYLVADIPFQLEGFNISSLKFKQDSIPYYYVAGY